MLPALRAAYAAHITDLDASSAEDAKPVPISHTLLGVAGGGLSVARGVALCVAEEAAARGCVSAAVPPSLPRALLRARRRVRRGLAIAEQGPTRRAAHSGRATR